MSRHKCEAVACLSSQVKCDFYELLYCALYLWRINLIWFNLIWFDTACPKKEVPLYFPLSLVHILTDFLNSFTDRLSSKFMAQIMKDPSIPQTRRYTNLWNVSVQKSQWPRAEWSELSCQTQPFQTVAQKYSHSDISIISFTGEKILQWPYRKPRRATECTHIHQTSRKTSRQNTCVHG